MYPYSNEQVRDAMQRAWIDAAPSGRLKRCVNRKMLVCLLVWIIGSFFLRTRDQVRSYHHASTGRFI
jgi:hypothetical protein